MPRKRRNQPPPDLTVAILVALRQQLPDLSSAHLNAVGHHIREAVMDVLTAVRAGGRPSRYPPALVRVRLQALLTELSMHYRRKGRWPDTKSKWDASTGAFTRGWWLRRTQDELAVRYGLTPPAYPAEALAERLGPHATKGTGSLLEVALFLGTMCWGIKPETLRSYLK